MTASSAGILTYRVAEHGTRVRLVHPGGPFRRHRDLGARSIPKGEPFPQEAAEKMRRGGSSPKSWEPCSRGP